MSPGAIGKAAYPLKNAGVAQLAEQLFRNSKALVTANNIACHGTSFREAFGAAIHPIVPASITQYYPFCGQNVGILYPGIMKKGRYSA